MDNNSNTLILLIININMYILSKYYDYENVFWLNIGLMILN